MAEPRSPTTPATKQVAVTPNDSADLPGGVCKALEVTADGTLSCVAEDDSVAVSRPTVVAGQIIQVRVKRVNATGTTATVVALY